VTAADPAEPEVVFEQRGHVAILRLNRPRRANALTVGMRDLVAEAWRRVNDDPQCRVVIVTGTGPRHFCTGVDVQAVAASGRATSGYGHVRDEVVWSPLGQGVRKPVICAVNGLAAGGGLHFVADADIVVAGEHAAFMDTHTSVGMVGAVENIGLTRRLPMGMVLRMTLEGREFRLTAERAYALGLVDELCPPGEELDRALAIAANIAKNSPRANQLSKLAIWSSVGQPHEQAAEYGWALARMHWSHPDFAEGPKAFSERREPRWQDE
jgi:enoyl-CoA hydratase/carnithine racemase